MVGILTPAGITVRKGDAFNIILQFRHDETPMDLEGCIVRMAVKDLDNKPVINKTGEIFESAGGKVRIALRPEDTNIEAAEYKTDIQITFKNGEVHTVYPQNVAAVAYFRVTEEVTQ